MLMIATLYTLAGLFIAQLNNSVLQSLHSAFFFTLVSYQDAMKTAEIDANLSLHSIVPVHTHAALVSYR